VLSQLASFGIFLVNVISDVYVLGQLVVERFIHYYLPVLLLKKVFKLVAIWIWFLLLCCTKSSLEIAGIAGLHA